MSTCLEKSHNVRETLEQLQVLIEQLKGQYVQGIKSPADYERATLLLDELTDGHELNRYEERILIELEDAILEYERTDSAFSSFNAEVESSATPVQLLRDLMETHGLSGSDLPEIGDKTVVSKILSGDRAISHKMAFALAERFGMDPKAFAAAPVRTPGKSHSGPVDGYKLIRDGSHWVMVGGSGPHLVGKAASHKNKLAAAAALGKLAHKKAR